MSERWARPKQHRDQAMVLPPTVSDLIPATHPIRRIDELLDKVDWSEWEAVLFRCSKIRKWNYVTVPSLNIISR